jgi:hypothetical protein
LIVNTISTSTYRLFYVHTKQIKQAISVSIIFIASIISKSTYPLFMHTQSELDQTNHISIHPIHRKLNIKHLLTGYFMHTQSELGQTSHVSIHYIHCKHNTNFYLPPILCTQKMSLVKQTTSASVMNSMLISDGFYSVTAIISTNP